jgi:hypothetical protein
MKFNINEQNIGNLLLSFFIFGTLFPTLRILIVGSQTSINIASYLFSILPEFMAVIVLFYSYLVFHHNSIILKLHFFDWAIIGFSLSNVLIGTFLAKNLLLSMYGIRMSYFPIIFYFIFRFGNLDLMLNTLNNIFKWFFIVGIIGIILYFGFYNQMLVMIQKTNPLIAEYFIVRMTSVFWSPVLFSTIMVTTFAYFYHRFLVKSEWYHYFVLGFVWLCVLLSVTRGGLIVLFIGFVFLSLLHKKWMLSFRVFVLFFFIFVIVGYYISSPLVFLIWIISSASDAITLKKGVTRVDLWIKAFESFKTQPFGLGLGKAGHVATRFFSDNPEKAAIYSTDGWYLKLANETGIWGLLSYFFLSIYFFVIFLKKNILVILDFKYSWIFAVFIMVNVQNLVSNVLDFYLFSFFYWGLLGLSFNIIYNKISKS